MIKFRKNPFSEQEIEIPHVAGETGKELLKRVMVQEGYSPEEESERFLAHFHLLVNGHIIEPDFLPFTKISEGQNVMIAPKVSRGAGGQLFKQIAIVVVAVVASVLLTPATGATIGSALTVAGVTAAASLALNALIPPPSLGSLGGLGGLNSYEASQMYTIASQQNSVRKFGKVPKVYGTFKMFPMVAANPYTEIEADASTGSLVQTFYCIYDFGFGPSDISEIKIGDTYIQDFSDAEWRLVDLNKPLVSTGPWDDAVNPTFQLYKGDVEKEVFGIILDANQEGGGPLDDYQVVRNASSNVQGAKQEITIDFQCPQGLIGYGTDGSTSQREITLNVEFSKVSENIWRPYNDPTFVDNFSGSGGSITTSYTSPVQIPALIPANYSAIGVPTEQYIPARDVLGISQPAYTQTTTKYGYLAGATFITATPGDAVVGDSIFRNGVTLGIVQSITPGPGPGLENYNFVAPIPVDVVVFEYLTFSNGGTPRVVKSIQVTQASADSRVNKVYRKIGSFGGVVIKAKNANPIYATVKFTPKDVAEYKVRVTRVSSYSAKTFQVQDKLTLLSIQSRFDRQPIITDKRHTFLEVKIRATNQLNGAIQNLSAVVKSVLPVYNTGTLQWENQVTSNPAWVYCDLITGELNKKALDKSRLHLDSILEWAELCDEVPTPPPSQTFIAPRFQCNFVLDFDTTLQSLLNSVTNAAQASLNIVDGKYGVLVDKLKTIPVQVFTPRNSWNFQSSRNYTTAPNAISVKYIDPENDWQVNEAVVYDNGFNASNVEPNDIEELSSFGCTTFEQAWRFGRYMLAQGRLRQENISIDVDFEHLVCTRGDFVLFTQDVMRTGGVPARVKTVSGNQVTIDDAIETSPGSYGYVARKEDGSIVTDTLTVVNASTFDLDGIIPAVGDLIIIGQVGQIVMECLVKAITPNSDLSATVLLVEKAAAVYDAESTDVLPLYDANLNSTVDPSLFAPGPVEDLIVTENSWRVVGTSYQYYVEIDWDVPAGSAYETFEVYVDSGQGYNLVDFTKESLYEYIVDPRNLDIPHNFKVVAVSANGKKIPLIEAPFVTATPTKKITPPSDVTDLFIDITNQVISFNWPAVSDEDLKEYLIRYSILTTGATWEASIPLLRVDRNTNTASYQGRTGTYFIKAVDFNLNESSAPASAITAIPNLFDLNVIDQTNDFPALLGVKEGVLSDGTGLILQTKNTGGPDTNEYLSEGYYYYEAFLDLGDIYTVRLQSQIEAEGYTVGDIMANWNPLSDVLALSNAGTAAWDVETQYRTTETLNVMADWVTLDSIDPISEGNQDNWTDWRKFVIGDATGRIFQFRLKLVSNVPNVTPRVFDGVIKSDMPDRVESYNNRVASPAGLTISYVPPFAGPANSPNIQITQDSAQTGDYFVITGKTLDGFTITFYDGTNVAVTRQFDAMVRGYGRKAAAVI